MHSFRWTAMGGGGLGRGVGGGGGKLGHLGGKLPLPPPPPSPAADETLEEQWHQSFYCQCRKLAFKKHNFLQSHFPALTTSFGVDITACSPNSAISSDWRHFLSREPVSADLNFRASRKACINAHALQGLTPSGSRKN